MKKLLPLLLAATAAWSAAAASRARFNPALDEYVLANDQSEAAFNAADLSLKRIRSTAHGFEVLARPGFSPFAIQLGHPAGVEYRSDQLTTLSARQFRECSVEPLQEPGGAALRLIYRDAPVADTGESMDVTVTVRLPDDSPLLRWELELDNRSDWPLNEIHFPTLRGLGFDTPPEGTDEYVAVPLYSGRLYPSPRTATVTNQAMSNYPGGGLTAQLMVYGNNRDQAFYFAAGDSENYTKTFVCEPIGGDAFQMASIHYADTAAAPGHYRLPYPMFNGPIAGDWYDGAKLYRAWTLDFERWKPLSLRTDVPQWFRDLTVWFEGHPLNQRLAVGNRALAERIVAIHRAMDGLPIGFHWYIWWASERFDYNYPAFFPAAEGFAEAVAKVQADGVIAMPYMNILLFETFLPQWQEGAEAAASRNVLGELNRDLGRGMWKADDRRFFTGICFGTRYWQDEMVALYGRMLDEAGPKMLYLDQLHNFPARCYARNHLHEMHGGNYIAEGERTIARRIRALRPAGEIALTGEGLGECFIDVVDGLLNGHCDVEPDSIPLFQAIYSDRVTEFGEFLHTSEADNPDIFTAKLAFALVRGRQLGWLNGDQFDPLAPESAAVMEILRRYARTRLAGSDFLFYGELLRQPDLSRNPCVTQSWYLWGSGLYRDYSLPAVMAGVYRYETDQLGFVLANHTATAQTVGFPWNREDWGMAPGTPAAVQIYRDGAWNEPAECAVPEEFALEIPPRDAVLVRWKPVRSLEVI